MLGKSSAAFSNLGLVNAAVESVLWIDDGMEQGTRFRRYTVNQKVVFFPELCPLLPERCERTRVHITLPMYTLCELALKVIRGRLTYNWQAFLLDIPRSLQYELAMMLPDKQVEGAVAVA